MGVLLITHDMVLPNRWPIGLFSWKKEIWPKAVKRSFADINNERIKSFIAG